MAGHAHTHEGGNGANANANGRNDASEHTPLISRTSGRHVTSSDRGSFLWHLLLDRKHSPGTHNPNPAVRWPAHAWHITKITLLSNYVNVLLVFVPLGIIAGKAGWPATWVFSLNFLAIIPLAAVLSYATEQIADKLGDTLGGLLNATFGNAVELIVSIIALRDGQIEVVQASMLGSILSNLLLVLGMCFFLGGIVNMRGPDGLGTEQSFASGTAQTTCSLMALSSASMIIPSTLYGILNHEKDEDKQRSILLLSRGTAIILLLLYCMYLYFQLRTHKNLFNPEIGTEDSEAEVHNHYDSPEVSGRQDDDPEEDETMSAWSAGAILIAVTVIISIAADYLVDSIDDIVEEAHISKSFIGLILIPIVGNAAEHVTACVVAVRNKMDLAMGVAIGSSIQIALFLTPVLVLLGWFVLDQPMSLRFETFETVVFALSVLIVTYTVQDGKSNYLEGAMLMGLYLIIALAFWASPSDALSKGFEWFHS